jgi:ribosomal protein L30E
MNTFIPLILMSGAVVLVILAAIFYPDTRRDISYFSFLAGANFSFMVANLLVGNPPLTAIFNLVFAVGALFVVWFLYKERIHIA